MEWMGKKVKAKEREKALEMVALIAEERTTLLLALKGEKAKARMQEKAEKAKDKIKEEEKPTTGSLPGNGVDGTLVHRTNNGTAGIHMQEKAREKAK